MEEKGTKYTKKLFKNYLQRCKTVIKCNYFSKVYETLARLMCFLDLAMERLRKCIHKKEEKIMKKKLALLLTALLVFTTTACGADNSSEPAAPADNAETESAAAPETSGGGVKRKLRQMRPGMLLRQRHRTNREDGQSVLRTVKLPMTITA